MPDTKAVEDLRGKYVTVLAQRARYLALAVVLDQATSPHTGLEMYFLQFVSTRDIAGPYYRDEFEVIK